MRQPEADWHAWVAKAENDLLNIQNNLSDPRIPWDTLCFHAQQAAEKLLKAFLVFHGRPPAHTHDLTQLLTECLGIDPALASLRPDCDALTDYGVLSRYPDWLDEPSEPEAREAIASAYRVREAVVSRLLGPGAEGPCEERD